MNYSSEDTYAVDCIAARHGQTFDDTGNLIREIEVQTSYVANIDLANVVRISPVDENSKGIALDEADESGKSLVIPKFAKTAIAERTDDGIVTHFCATALNDVPDALSVSKKADGLSWLVTCAINKINPKPVTAENFGVQRPRPQVRQLSLVPA